MRYVLIPPLLATAVLAGCTQTPRPTPAVVPAPVVTAPDVPEPDWRDRPLSPGLWTYAPDVTGSTARFGPAGIAPVLTLRCDKAVRAIRIVRAGATTGPMTLTTSYGPRDLPLARGATGMEATLAATDPLLDRIAFSRGRVSYAAPGMPLLVTPAWAEPARVIEDCRG